MNRSMLLLVGAVVFEVLWAVMLKLAGGFARPWASAVMAVAYVLSLVVFHEPLSLGRAIGFMLVIAGVVVLIGLEPRASSAERFLRPSSS
jgi:multidrug transporter EmrE-like cation transporter